MAAFYHIRIHTEGKCCEQYRRQSERLTSSRNRQKFFVVWIAGNSGECHYRSTLLSGSGQASMGDFETIVDTKRVE